MSHEQPTIRDVADCTVIMYPGQVIKIGPTETVIRERRHPYTQLLIGASARTSDMHGPFTTRPERRGRQGAASSTHRLASAAGLRVPDPGSKAFDAAVATGFVLQVVEPLLNGPGGELPAIFHHADSGETRVTCAQGVAAAAADTASFRGMGAPRSLTTGFCRRCFRGPLTGRC